MNQETLIDIIRQSTRSVLSLKYKLLLLSSKPGDEPAKAFKAIPSFVTTLDLSSNGLGVKTSIELTKILAAIPSSISILNLSWNEFGIKSGAELVEAFKVIPLSVTILNLSENDFKHKSNTELTDILAAIPLTVQAIIVREVFSTEQVRVIHQFRRQQRINDLANQVGNRLELEPYSSNNYDFTMITPSRPIDEDNLAEVIDDLEQKNTASAYIAAAMLLLGDIENTITSDRTTEGEVAYSNQRTHDAIQLLFKAVQCDPRYRDSIAHIAKTLQMRFPEGSLFYCRLALLQPQAEPSSALAHALGLFGGGDNFMARLLRNPPPHSAEEDRDEKDKTAHERRTNSLAIS